MVFSISGLSCLQKEDFGFLFNWILIKAKAAAGCFPHPRRRGSSQEKDRASREKPQRESEKDLSRGLTFQSYSSLLEEKEEDQRVEVP